MLASPVIGIGSASTRGRSGSSATELSASRASTVVAAASIPPLTISATLRGENGKVRSLVACRVEWKKDPATGQMKMAEVPDTEFEMPADLVLLAMGFVNPVHQGLLDQLGVAYDPRGNVKADTEGAGSYATSLPKVFTAGDMRRGQSLVVWAIREGRQCAREIDVFLTGSSDLPR